MRYDLTQKDDRKRFVYRCNALLRNKRNNIVMTDESNRTLNQNSYLHVLLRILAAETGVTERYAKDTYFKILSNPDIFVRTMTDPITHESVTYTRSTSELTVEEMNRAINTFRHWSEENGYYLPEARPEDDGSMTFSTEEDEKAFHAAEIYTSKLTGYIG